MVNTPPRKRKETLISRVYRIIYKCEPPYYCYYSIGTILKKPIRKWFSAVLIPTIPFNNLRVLFYRWCGYKIGKHVFIGMRCYLDDMCFDMIEIGDNVTISYGVYFACHGRKQTHKHLTIKNGAYVGMKATIIARNDIVIGENAVVGAGTLVNKSVPDASVVVGVPCRILQES